MGKHYYELMPDGRVETRYDAKDAEARDKGYMPSVTTVKGDVMVNYGLALWKEGQLIRAVEGNPRYQQEDDKTYYRRVREAASTKKDTAADFGTRVHDAIEKHPAMPDDPQIIPFYNAWVPWYETNVDRTVANEFMLYDKQMGVAGKCDSEIIHKQHGLAIVDYKTKDMKGKNVTRSSFYPEWAMQLAVYEHMRRRLTGRTERAACISVVVPSDRPERPTERVWTPEELESGFKQFVCLAWVWMDQRNHWPLGRWEVRDIEY